LARNRASARLRRLKKKNLVSAAFVCYLCSLFERVLVSIFEFVRKSSCLFFIFEFVKGSSCFFIWTMCSLNIVYYFTS
jgi:hypothetical protein